SCEIILQLRANGFEMAMFPGHHVCLQSFPQNRHLTFCRTAVDELQQAQTVVVGNSDHGAERRVNSLRKQRCARLRVAWRFAKNFSECFAKAAVRLKSTPVSRFVDATALPYAGQGKAHPACAMIRLKCHPIMAFELSPRCGWIDGKGRQLLVGQSPARRSLDLG